MVKSVPIPVVIAGGPKMTTDREVLELVWEALDAGAAGLSIGRNVFGADNVPRLCRAVAGVVRDVDMIQAKRNEPKQDQR